MPEQLSLAIIAGAGFGAIVHLIGSSWQRLTVLLVLLYVMQTFSQQVWRVLDGRGSLDELVIVSQLRLGFSVAAIVVLAVLNRRSRWL